MPLLIAALPGNVHQRQHRLYYRQDMSGPPETVQVWDEGRLLGVARVIDKLPMLGAHEQAAQHVKAKQARLSQQKKCLKEIKQKAQQPALVLPAQTEAPALPATAPALEFRTHSKPAPMVDALLAANFAASDFDDATEKELAEKARKQQEKRRRANPALYQHSGE